MNFSLKSLRNETVIIIICLIGLVIRLWGLNTQSLWLDELHTMNGAGPASSWSDLFDFLKKTEHHPPLFFMIEKCFFSIFDHSAYTARFVSAIAGTMGIWAMYQLGKEILNKQLGIFCGIISCVNFFCISYSQEARPYALVFLLTVLSFTWFIRLVKIPSRKNLIGYTLCTTLLLYTHYYSLFVFAAQVVLGIIFILNEKDAARRSLAKFFSLSLLIICVAYSPWFGYLKINMDLRTFWITEVQPTFLKDYFYGYFGNAELLNPILLMLLFFFFIKAGLHLNQNGSTKLKEQPLLLACVVCLCWIFISVLIPYVRSLMVVPMLYPRYTMVIVPAILLILAYAL